jgi:hypothetical protein
MRMILSRSDKTLAALMAIIFAVAGSFLLHAALG